MADVAEVRISDWMKESRIDSCSVIRHDSGRSSPDVLLQAPAGVVRPTLLRVIFESRANGVHVTFFSHPDSKHSPVLRLVMEDMDMRKITAGLLATVATRAEDPSFETPGRTRDEWFRKMYKKLHSMAVHDGPPAFSGLTPNFMTAATECKQALIKSFGHDIDDLKESVRRAFSMLAGRVDDKEIADMWRTAKAARAGRV